MQAPNIVLQFCKTTYIPFLIATGLLAAGKQSHAQDLPDVAQGLQPYAAYHGGNLDQVNLMNGGLTVRIPLVSFPQKGKLRLSYSLLFNSFAFQDVETCSAQAPQPTDPVTGEPIVGVGAPVHAGCVGLVKRLLTGLPSALPLSPRVVADQELWSGATSMTENAYPVPGVYTPPMYDGRYYVLEPDGSEHALANTDSGYRSVDESGYLFSPTNAPSNLGGGDEALYPGDVAKLMGPAAGTITDSDGLTYTANQISDSSGNSISLPNSPGGGGGTYSIGLPAYDSIGRNIPDLVSATTSQCPNIATALNQPLTTAMTWSVPASGGTATYLFCYVSVDIYTHIPVNTEGTSMQSRQLHQTVTMLQSVTLPNHTFWGFVWDSNDPSSTWAATASTLMTGTGQLMTLIYPTGGSVNYSYGFQSGQCSGLRVTGTNPDGATVLLFAPSVESRTLVDSTGQALGTWNYATGSVVTPRGELTLHSLVQDPTPDRCGFYDGGATVYQGPDTSSPILKQTTIAYSFNDPPGLPYVSAPRVTSVTTTTSNAATSTVTYSYAPPVNFYQMQCSQQDLNCGNGLSIANPIGSATSKSYTDYNGSALKSDSVAYQWQSNSDYLNANLINLPAQRSVKDASGTTLSKSQYTYDEPSYSSGGVRGNLTTTTAWLNSSNQVSPTVHIGWNASGMMIYTTDADANAGSSSHLNPATGHTVDYQYNDCGGSALTDSYNAIGQHTSAAYDCGTGLLSSETDANGSSTAVVYDSMGRILSFTYPLISGQATHPTTSFSYTDAQNTVTKTVLAAPDTTQSTQIVFDGFGRETKRLSSDALGMAESDTTYDADGHVYSVSNPYHSIAESTYGLTTTTYDALGRKLIVTEPDSNTIRTQYTGPTTDTWDENSTHMQYVADALGRVTHVYELGTPSDPHNLETDYTYDALGNLWHVSQLGLPGTTLSGFSIPESSKTRSFTYDSLSRLLTSTNPETGTICYGILSGSSCDVGYDANGNLQHKTDANSTRMDYTYDALNRLTSKIATDNSVVDNYFYDALPSNYVISAFSCSYGVGRLCIADHIGTSGTAFSYDALGRIASTRFANAYGNGYATGVSASYDLAGNILQLTYPDGRSVTQTFDAAGRLASITDTTSGTSTSYISNLQYWQPSGAVTSFTLGNGVTQSTVFNNRLQPCHTIAATPTLPNFSNGNNLLDRQTAYSQPTVSNAPSPCGAESGDNGNIWSIVDNRAAGWTQSFQYDGLNRLSSAFRNDGAYGNIYHYDSFGNLAVQDTIHTNPTWAVDPNTNQLLMNPIGGSADSYGHPANSYVYDYAGNMTSSGVNNIGAHQYSYNALSQLMSVDGGAATYSYNGLDERAIKQVGENLTYYVYFNGQPLAELDNTGNWSDYIYANGEKIAKVTDLMPIFHMHGVRDGSTPNMGCGVQPLVPGMSASVANQTIRAGDTLVYDLKQTSTGSPMASAFGLDFQGGYVVNYIGTGGIVDQLGNQPGAFTISDDAWHHSVSDLSSLAGEVVSSVQAGIQGEPWTGYGTWDLWLANAAIVRADGSVLPMFTGQSTSVVGIPSTCGGNQQTFQTEMTPVTDPKENTNYYVADHLGTTSIELSGSGWPIWQGQFTPFGQELLDGSTAMHYKFTGKERDTESGLDYFGARYYASNMGRFMSPDWASDPTAVPYASYANPQSLNLYNYMRNNPLGGVDPDGHCCWDEVKGFVGQINNLVPDTLNQPISMYNWAASAVGGRQIPYLQGVDLNASPGMQRGAVAAQVTLAVGVVAGPALAPEAAAPAAEGQAAGVSDATLSSRAAAIQGAQDSFGQTKSTIATASVTDASGNTSVMVGSSRNALTRSQRAALQPGETAVTGPGHAETTVINAAQSQGKTVNAVAASRPTCANCSQAIQNAGARQITPTKQP